MLTITVAQDGSGNFATIGEAVQAVPYDTPARILIGPGTYREKLACDKQSIAFQGAGMAETRLVWNEGGKLPHPDGRPTHTFRSWTAFFSGGEVTVEDMTIENDAGPGSLVGQGIAAYVDTRRAVFRRVRLLGNQDTLFCAPLPEKEREKDGFLGPRVFTPRLPSAQYYQSCEIAGDIDFIFGGADALFEQCVIRSVDNGPGPCKEAKEGRGYVTAPSTPAGGLGFVFWDCDFVSPCPAASAAPNDPTERMNADGPPAELAQVGGGGPRPRGDGRPDAGRQRPRRPRRDAPAGQHLRHLPRRRQPVKPHIKGPAGQFNPAGPSLFFGFLGVIAGRPCRPRRPPSGCRRRRAARR